MELYCPPSDEPVVYLHYLAFMLPISRSRLLTLPPDSTVDDLKRTIWENTSELRALDGKLHYRDLRVWKLNGEVSADPSCDALQRCEAAIYKNGVKGLSPNTRVSDYWSTEHDPCDKVDFHIRFTKHAMRKAGLYEPFDVPEFWPSVCDFPASDYGRAFRLEYDGVRITKHSRYAFLYRNSDGKGETIEKFVVVKFCTRYCIKAHELLARRGLAPPIQFFGHLPAYHNCLYFVVMNAIIPARGVPSASTLTTIQNDITQAVDLLHREDMVHGDIRPGNIILYREHAVSYDTLLDGEIKAMLIDYDWGGEEGEARYPDGINMKEIWWPSGVEPGGLISKEHDRQMLEWMQWDEVMDGILPLAEEHVRS